MTSTPAPPCVVVLSEFSSLPYDYQSVQEPVQGVRKCSIIACQCSAALVVRYGFYTSPHAAEVVVVFKWALCTLKRDLFLASLMPVLGSLQALL